MTVRLMDMTPKKVMHKKAVFIISNGYRLNPCVLLSIAIFVFCSQISMKNNNTMTDSMLFWIFSVIFNFNKRITLSVWDNQSNWFNN